jgi:hypothetical protein
VPDITDQRISAMKPLLPQSTISARSRQLILFNPDAKILTLVYAPQRVDGSDGAWAALKSGAFKFTQKPYTGQDAELVHTSLTGNRWYVQLGTTKATLVWADPVAAGVRPFGLYWADGSHDFILQGAPEGPDELVDFARSLYCAGQ